MLCCLVRSWRHDWDFPKPLVVRYDPSETQARLALYDADASDRLTEDQLLGTAQVAVSVLASGKSQRVALQKEGREVTGCYLLLNPSDAELAAEQQASAAVPTKVASAKVDVKLTAFGELFVGSATGCEVWWLTGCECV